MLARIIRPCIHHTGRECLRRASFGPVNHNDHKRPKVAETDSLTFSENTPMKARVYYLKCAFLDAVMIGKPVFYG